MNGRSAARDTSLGESCCAIRHQGRIGYRSMRSVQRPYFWLRLPKQAERPTRTVIARLAGGILGRLPQKGPTNWATIEPNREASTTHVESLWVDWGRGDQPWGPDYSGNYEHLPFLFIDLAVASRDCWGPLGTQNLGLKQGFQCPGSTRPKISRDRTQQLQKPRARKTRAA